MMRDATRRDRRCRSSCRSAREDTFSGVVDLIERKALYWDDESQGAVFSRPRIPAELARGRRVARDKLLEAVADVDDADGEVPGRRSDVAAERAPQGAPRGDDAISNVVPVLCGSGLQEQGRAAAARRGRRLPAVARSTCRRSKGIGLKGSRTEDAAARRDDEPFAALVFKI